MLSLLLPVQLFSATSRNTLYMRAFAQFGAWTVHVARRDSTSWTKRCCKSVIKVGLRVWNTLLTWAVSEVRNGWGSTYNIWVSHNLTSSFANLNAKGTPYYCIDEFLGFLGASVCFLQLQYGHLRSRNNKLLELVIRVEHDSDDDQLPKNYYIQDYIQTRRSHIFVLSHLLCVFHIAFGDLNGPQIRVCDPCFQHAKPWQRNIYVIFDGLKKQTYAEVLNCNRWYHCHWQS